MGSERAIQRLQIHSIQFGLVFFCLKVIQLCEESLILLKMSCLLGRFVAKTMSLRNLHKYQRVVCTTTSKKFFRLLGTGVESARVIASWRVVIEMLLICHQSMTPFHVSFATSHSTNRCSSNSIASSQIGQRMEWSSCNR